MTINREEIWRLEREAHDLIVEICESKNIKLRLRQQGASGHMQYPEIWALEKPVPLNAKDLEAINACKGLSVETKIGADGIACAERFIRSGGWVRYEEDTNPEAKFIF